MTYRILLYCSMGLLALGGCSDDDGGPAGSTSSSSSSNASSSSGAGGGGGSGGMGGAGGAEEQEINGCLMSTAEDQTMATQIVVNWANPSERCVIMKIGQSVIWNGDLMANPLAGGTVSDEGVATKDPSSFITNLDQSGAVATTVVSEEGVFPYYSEANPDTMKGVIYIVADTGAGGAGGSN